MARKAERKHCARSEHLARPGTRKYDIYSEGRELRHNWRPVAPVHLGRSPTWCQSIDRMASD
jgi:hypothetical protein